MDRIASHIVLDEDRGAVTINGNRFHYLIHPSFEVVGTSDDEMLGVRVTIYADKIDVLPSEGASEHFAMPSRSRSTDRPLAERARDAVTRAFDKVIYFRR